MNGRGVAAVMVEPSAEHRTDTGTRYATRFSFWGCDLIDRETGKSSVTIIARYPDGTKDRIDAPTFREAREQLDADLAERGLR